MTLCQETRWAYSTMAPGPTPDLPIDLGYHSCNGHKINLTGVLLIKADMHKMDSQ